MIKKLSLLFLSVILATAVLSGCGKTKPEEVIDTGNGAVSFEDSALEASTVDDLIKNIISGFFISRNGCDQFLSGLDPCPEPDRRN